MKNLLLIALSVLSGFASAQQLVKESCIMISEPVNIKLSKRVLTDWYDYVNSAGDNGVTWKRITNATLFPDSLVKQLYGAAGGGVVLGQTGTHSVGQVFDPRDQFYIDPEALTQHNPYFWDSLQILYQYAHNLPGTVDTLLVQFYTGSAVIKGTLQGDARPVAWVAYNKATNMGSASVSSVKIPLNQEDTTNWVSGTPGLLTIPVPNGGINVTAINTSPNYLVAFTMSYIPGYSYNLGDTIQHDWEVPPVKKLNHFKYGNYQDDGKVAQKGYNNGLKAISASRYRTDTWPGNYIPGRAWLATDESVYSLFHISSPNVGINAVSKILRIYPNPIIAGGNISFEGVNGSFDYILTDVQGRVINQGTGDSGQIKTAADMSAGTYYLQLNTKETTYKSTVVIQ